MLVSLLQVVKKQR